MDAKRLTATETVSASAKLGRTDAAALVQGADRVIVSKGRKVEEFEPKERGNSKIVDAMLGPTGNLRAPCLRVGNALLIGFNEEAYETFFSKRR